MILLEDLSESGWEKLIKQVPQFSPVRLTMVTEAIGGLGPTALLLGRWEKHVVVLCASLLSVKGTLGQALPSEGNF